MVRQWQELFNQRRYSFVDIESPDFVKLASAYGIAGKMVDDRKDLAGALKEMMENKGAFVLEVMVTKENNVFPMVPQGCSVSEIRLK
jgi:acetolactate synthase-1/2/3 large subunit